MNKITNYNSFNYSNKIIKNDFCSENFMSKGYIKKFLHLNDNNLTNPEDKLYKLRPFLSKISYLWKKHYSLGKTICIDEKMIPWRGRTKWKQYCPDKPTKFGFKTFILCDASTNYIYNFDIYTGKKDKPTKDLGGSVV